PVGNMLGYMNGWLIYGRNDGVIAARRFDQRARRFSGEAVPLLDGATWQDEGGLEAVLSANGTLAYMRGDAVSSLVLVDAKGAVQSTAVSGMYSNPAWSPDGKRIAVDKLSFGGGGSGDGGLSAGSIWIYDIASRALSRVTGKQ